MNIIEEYFSLAKQKRFAEGLRLIEEIVRRNPDLATSQFNYGICLAELGDNKQAAKAFLRAYSLKPDDGHALYRACLALASADDATKLLELFRQECSRDPEMNQDFLEEKRFARFWELPDFVTLKSEYVKKLT